MPKNHKLPTTHYPPRKASQRGRLPANSGVVILFSILTIGVLLSIVLTLSAIFIPKVRLSGETRNSVGALYAAESGIEWCLYTNRIGPVSLPVMANGASYTDGNGGALDSSDCAASPIKVLGAFRAVTRAFEVSF